MRRAYKIVGDEVTKIQPSGLFIGHQRGTNHAHKIGQSIVGDEQIAMAQTVRELSAEVTRLRKELDALAWDNQDPQRLIDELKST